MPKLFGDIAGQRRAVSILSAHLKSGNLAHAYLFLGSEGIGKKYLAKKLAHYILCPKTTDDDCESCRKFQVGSHPDFIYLDGSEGIKIEQVREMIERINLSPVLSGYKVFLITHTENIGLEAANALLKTLEEPPRDSIIILTGTSEKRLPETVVSRSQVVKLNPATEKEIRKILEREFESDDITEVIDLAEGSIGEVKKLLTDTGASKAKKKMVDDLGALLSSRSIIERFKIIEEYDKSQKLRELYDQLARALFGHLLGSSKPSLMPEDISRERQINMARKILKIYLNLDYNVSLRTAMEDLMLKDILSV